MNISLAEQKLLISVACQAADAARVVTLSYFRQPNLAAENKASIGYDPVTLADKQAETSIRAVIQELRPHDSILGEEQGDVVGTSGLTWVLDPIDGTRGFVAGTPTWGVLISVRDETGPIFGLIDQPYIGERFLGGFGLSEYRRTDKTLPLTTSRCSGLKDAILLSTFPEIGTDAERSAFSTLSQKTQLTRYGMDCYGYALLAVGSVDLVVEAGLFPYDIQAPIAVVQAAGGVVTDWRGNPAHDGGRVIAAATPVLHQAALEILSKAPPNL
ncbi:MAG: inositol monophosphatase family protein [Paracoccaceae bacterium]